MSMSITIRKARLDDVPALEKLIHASVTDLSKDFYSVVQIESALIHVFGVDTQLIKDETYFVAEAGTEIVGAGGWSKRQTLFGGDQTKSKDVEPLLDPAEDAARIRAFYVHPRWARKGIGSRILQTCEEAAINAGFSRVELVATLPGVPLYEAHEYVATNPLDLETPDGQSLPAFLMEKSLRS
jgi:predicted N-acetyltransferase YhbS